MSAELNGGLISKALESAYETAVNGMGVLESSYELANDYMKESGSIREKVDSLIRWQCAKTGTSGFITGLGGLITLPIGIPADLASNIFIQVRMIAAIAHMGGYDIKDDRVKTLVFCCLAGNSANELFSKLAIEFGKKIATQVIKQISGKTIIEINKKVGFRLLTKFGEKGVVNLGKAIPLVGGLIGAGFNTFTTNMIGDIARDKFIGKQNILN